MQEETKAPKSAKLETPLTIPEGQTRDILILHLRQGMSIESVAEIFSLEIEEVAEIVRNFVASFSSREYLDNVLNCMIKMSKNRVLSSTLSGDNADSDSASQEISRLKRELTEAKLEAEFYKEMVLVAESTFNIPIRKKFGAK